MIRIIKKIRDAIIGVLALLVLFMVVGILVSLLFVFWLFREIFKWVSEIFNILRLIVAVSLKAFVDAVKESATREEK